MRKLVLFFLVIINVAFGQTLDYDTTFNGTPAKVHLPSSGSRNYYNVTDSFPVIIFCPGNGENIEISTPYDTIGKYGPHDYLSSGWDGYVIMANGDSVYFIVITLDRNTDYVLNESYTDDRLNSILGRYRIKPNSVHVTGLSGGGHQWQMYVTGDNYDGTAPYGPFTFADKITSLFNAQGVQPDDNTDYLNKIKNYPRNSQSGKYFGIWDLQDADRQIPRLVDSMNVAVSGSASYTTSNLGHDQDAWWAYYGKGDGTAPTEYSIEGFTQNVYEWMIRQGDTSETVWTPVGGGGALNANAGADQTIYMPKTTVTLNASGSTGATSYTWVKLSGGVKPQEGVITSPSNVSTTVTNLGVSVYTFELTVSDGATTDKDTVVVTGYAQKSRTPNPNFETFTLNPTGGGGGEYYFTNIMSTYPTLNGGDTIILNGSVTGVCQLYGADADGGWGGDSVYPVVIRPPTGTTAIEIGGAFRLDGQYVTIAGDYNVSRGVTYGFKLTGSSTSGFVWTTKHSNVKVRNVWMEGGNNGIFAKNNIDSNNVLTYYPHWQFKNDSVIYNKFANQSGEAMYMGHTFFFDGGQPTSGYQPVPHNGLVIKYDTVTNAGWDGIQISNAFNTYIGFNYVNIAGSANQSSQMYGIIFGGYSWGLIEYNYIKKSQSSGIAIFGKDVVRAVGNYIDSCGRTGTDGVFTSIYINDNNVAGNPYTYPDLKYYVDSNCIRGISSYTGGAAIRSNDGNNTTDPSFILSNSIQDPSSRPLTSIIFVDESGTTQTGNILQDCTPPVPPATGTRWKKIRARWPN